jgi:hypothetical protein
VLLFHPLLADFDHAVGREIEPLVEVDRGDLGRANDLVRAVLRELVDVLGVGVFMSSLFIPANFFTVIPFR